MSARESQEDAADAQQAISDSDSTDNDFQDDDDDVDEDANAAGAGGIRNNKGRCSQMTNASMTESYSEIMNSPTDSGAGLLDDAAGPSGHHSHYAAADSRHVQGCQSASSGPYPIPRQRPGSLPTGGRNSAFPQGTVSVGDGNMMHFVADNLEHKIKAASPNPRKDSETTGRLQSFDAHSEAQSLIHRQFLSSIPQIDPNVLNDIEIEAQYLASNIDNLTENLCNLVHSISSIAADNVETHKTAVNKLTDCMDANIKTMYTIMAKTEEMSNRLKSMDGLAARIKELKRMVDVLDNIA